MVVVFHNLSYGQVNPDKLFNLYCQIKEVSKILFMKTKSDFTMVDMADIILNCAV